MNVNDISNNNIIGDNEEQAGEKNNVSNTKGQSNNIHETENGVVSNEKYKPRKKRARESIEEINKGESQSRAINKTITQKSFIKWTDDLHAKFMEVMQHFGEEIMMVDTTSAAMSMLPKGNQKIDVMILNVHSVNMLSFHLLAQVVALDIISLIMMVDTISTAMSMLSKGKQQIDVMILNVHSSNMLSFHLLAQVVALNIISFVMMVDTTSAAISMLSKGKQQIDVMILNVHSSNMLSFHLLAQAMVLDIISLVICDEDDGLVAKKALDEGAYLCLNKPFDKEIVKYLWQFVLRKKIKKEKARKGSEKHRDHMIVDDISNNDIGGENKEQSREKKNVYNTEEQSKHIHKVENDVRLNAKYKLKRKRGRKRMKEINEGESQSNVINKIVKQKGYIEWIDGLHVKFVEAIHQFGEGKCYPRKFLR